ncbi:hypothetical protein B0H17DRAFT_1141793 [Mycena rosella]|uniref:Uncharacterized protein n=1 Tax=Mycena rosella TaxID=1033263 RepID=A0AAD7CZ01_MYCRO|nr:hypothetical protein B0H17DRAFT_1141793 [Mycena rosella]
MSVRAIDKYRPAGFGRRGNLEHILQAVSNLECFIISGLVVRSGELLLTLPSSIQNMLARSGLERLHLLNMRHVGAPALLRVSVLREGPLDERHDFDRRPFLELLLL